MLTTTADGSLYIALGKDGVGKIAKDGTYRRVPASQPAIFVAADPTGLLYYRDVKKTVFYYVQDPVTSALSQYLAADEINSFAPLGAGSILYLYRPKPSIPMSGQLIKLFPDGTKQIISGPEAPFADSLGPYTDKLAFDPTTNIVLVSYTDGRIVRFGSDGHIVTVFGNGSQTSPNLGGRAVDSRYRQVEWIADRHRRGVSLWRGWRARYSGEAQSTALGRGGSKWECFCRG